MKLTKKTIRKNRTPHAGCTQTGYHIKLPVPLCFALYHRKRLQMEGTAEKVRELALGLHEVQPLVPKWYNPKNL